MNGDQAANSTEINVHDFVSEAPVKTQARLFVLEWTAHDSITKFTSPAGFQWDRYFTTRFPDHDISYSVVEGFLTLLATDANTNKVLVKVTANLQ
jgi:hypothetical protein